MSRKPLVTMIISVASVALAFRAFGQATHNFKADNSASAQNPVSEVAKASDIIGMTVKNDQGQKLGRVSDLAVDVNAGRITQVILSTGGFLATGHLWRAVPPGAFKYDATCKTLVLNIEKPKFEAAPKFDMAHWSQYSDSEHLAAIYRYYHEAPAFQFVTPRTNSADSVAKTNPGGTWDDDRTIIDNKEVMPSDRLAEMQRASKIIGMPITTPQDRRLGNVENIMVDLPAGRVLKVIVSTGGFLGLGGELSAIQPGALRFDYVRDRLNLDISRETLRNAPHFKPDEWPNFNQPGYASK